MTNDEKARDILNCNHCTLGEKICFGETPTPCVSYRDIIKMAEWKDEQNTEYLIKIKNALEEMAQICDKLTSGNVAHQRPLLNGYAKGWVELIDEYIDNMKGE